ncbi:helix-turn-helix domain-containing protein [Bacillus sp. ISL-7]|uniref:helix-turn-helix domain-containing protein n=1 Tax=Bacillus sp. ISL-7 TaxID=2819136 RepID=UPI001BE7888F|nr:helix-turn-helix transcriptional regulator [Bacillus sp. ISL-7]MBT2735329.1 helix-turn-helix transcriptional regulator [Bacillus sp. ISL-7]
MIGERIRELRKRKKLTLRELAQELGVPFTTLGNYERGDRQPDFDFVLAVAKYFGVSMDYLTKGDEAENYDEYKTNRYTEDVQVMLNRADPEAKELILDLHDQLFLIAANLSGKELEQLLEIFKSIYQMKIAFGVGITKETVPPSTIYEIVKSYLKEKQEINIHLDQLFESFTGKSVK